MVGFAGLLANYHGDFDFESGRHYPENLNYTVMRVFLAMFGVIMAPLAYLTCKEWGLTNKAAIFAGIAVMCDNAFLSISRYILLDSMLLGFTVFAFYCLSVFHNCKKIPFTGEWWFWLCMTGVGIGCVSSVKWVGFFVTALIGLYTIEDLWNLFGDLSLSKVDLLKHFFARVFGLIIVPVSIYVFSFWLHFAILIHSGSGDAQMSSLFQAHLIGNHFHENPLNVAYGSRVTFKNNGYGGGLLHSHVQTYPHGSKQQQVTTYHHRDNNNDWEIKYIRDHGPSDPEEIRFVKNGDLVRLVHAQTGRNLHSHPIAGPVTKTAWEVSGYGNETIGDTNDNWLVEIVDDVKERRVENVRSLTTRFRLKHVNLNCYLRAHHVTLPQWGFKQGEVVCDKQLRKDVFNLWNVEQHWNEKLPAGSPENYKTNFLDDFIHLNVAMYVSNNALTPDPDKEPDTITSSPSEWPFLNVGLRMCSWDDSRFKVYLLGNPILWWSSTVSLGLFVAVSFFYVLRQRRGCADWKPEDWQNFTFLGRYFLLGWFLHYLPFGIMARVTYLHHYFPALYFAILMLALMVDHFGSYSMFPKVVRNFWYLTVSAITVGVFFFFAPLSYGTSAPASDYKNRKWLSTWNVYG